MWQLSKTVGVDVPCVRLERSLLSFQNKRSLEFKALSGFFSVSQPQCLVRSMTAISQGRLATQAKLLPVMISNIKVLVYEPRGTSRSPSAGWLRVFLRAMRGGINICTVQDEIDMNNPSSYAS